MSRDAHRDEIADWVDALGGRAPAGTVTPATREATALRAGILARPAPAEDAVPEVDAAREAALVARARREGLLPGGAAVAPTAARRGRRLLAALAAAAAVVLAAGLLFRPAPPEEPVRGAPGGVVRLQDDRPEALQRTLIEELRAAGVRATGYERLGRFGVDADLPRPAPPGVADVLRRHGIPAPEDGVLSVEIAPRAAE